jgi:hypothetical protein
MLQGSLMIDSTDFRSGGNENAELILQDVGRKDMPCRTEQRASLETTYLCECKTPFLGCVTGRNQNAGRTVAGLLQAAQKGSQRGRR